MKSVVQINVTANTGSTGKIAEQIGVILKEKGWTSYIAFGRSYNNSVSDLIRIGQPIDYCFHGIKTRLIDAHGLASVASTKRFINKLKEINPDIIHLHNIHGYYINYKLLFEYIETNNKPVIWTLHDCWPFTGHCAHFDFIHCEKWKSHCNNCPGLNTYPRSLFVDRSFKNFELKKKLFTKVLDRLVLVPVSNWINSFIDDSFLREAERHVIHNGIDINQFSPILKNNVLAKYGIPEGKIIILGVASPWTERKGLYDFYRLRKLLSYKDYLIVLVGLSEKQIKNNPYGIIGIQKTQSQKELALFYSVANVFVNLTYEDNFPTTNLEALACGTPVITYKTGGSPEALTKETGWVVEQGAVEYVARIIKGFSLKKESEVLSQKKACREQAESEFDKNKCFKKYIELYDKLIMKQ